MINHRLNLAYHVLVNKNCVATCVITTTELHGCNRDHMMSTAYNLYYLALYRKSLLTSVENVIPSLYKPHSSQQATAQK